MEALLKEQEGKLGKSNFTEASAEDRLRRIRTGWDQCRRLHLQLELTATPEERETVGYFQDELFERAEAEFEAASDFFTNLIAKLRLPTVLHSTATSENDLSAESSNLTQLPRIPLPTFSGRYVDWTSFADLFESLVKKNRALDDVQRLHYLKGALEGPAASAVSHLPITAANFAVAWQLLRDRFDNPRLVVGALLNEFLSITPLKDDRGSGLVRLRDQTNKSIAQLNHLGRPTEHWDDLLVHITVQKLDARTRAEWGNSLGSRPTLPTYRELDAFIASRIGSLATINVWRTSADKVEFLPIW